MIAKERLRQWVDAAAAGTGLLAPLRARARRGVTLLMYHRVLPRESIGDYFEGLALEPETLEAQARWLARECDVVVAKEAARRLAAGEVGGPRPVVAVTFDDGYRDNFEHAAAILERHGLRGTFFVSTDFAPGGAILWCDAAARAWREDRGACRRALSDVRGEPATDADVATLDAWMSRLKRLGHQRRSALVAAMGGPGPGEFEAPMDATMLRSLHERGHEVASHTCSHPMMPELDDAALDAECARSRGTLESLLGAPVEGICYPNGRADARVREAAARAGYRYGCTTRAGLNLPGVDPLMLCRNHASRLAVTDTDGRHHEASFAAVVFGLHAALRGALGRFAR